MLTVYKPDYIAERYEITERTAALIASDTLPVVAGITHDDPGTNLGEQGLSIHQEGDDTLLGYHVVDVGAFPIAGELERFAYERLTESIDVFGKHHRLFEGANIFNKLNLIRAAVPVMSFYFEPTDGWPSLARVERSVFQQTEDGDAMTRQLSDLLGQYPNVTKKKWSSLINGEYVLNIASTDHVTDVLDEAGWPILADERDRVSISRPLRAWTDFKNLQMFTQVTDGETPLYTQAQLDAMQSHAYSETRTARREDIAPHPLGQAVVDLLKAPDIRAAVLSDDRYRELVDGLASEAEREDIMLVNIMNWALRTGLAKRDGQEVTLHNLDSTIRLAADGDLTPLTAIDALHKVLAYRPRSDEEARRVRSTGLKDMRSDVHNRLYPLGKDFDPTPAEMLQILTLTVVGRLKVST